MIHNASMNFKILILLFSFVAVLYIPVNIISTHKNLIEIRGTLKEIKKSRNRNPYFEFKLNEFPCTFHNPGNGTLNIFKNDIEMNVNQVVFYIDKKAKDDLQSNSKIIYMGFNKKNLIIDVYYKIVRPNGLVHFLFIFSSFIILCVNVFCFYVYNKARIFELSSIAFLVHFILTMAL